MKEFFSKLWKGTKKVCLSVGKRNWIIILCVFAVGLAVCLNFVIFSKGDQPVDYGNSNMADNYNKDDETISKTNTQTAAEYFASTVLDRQRARDEAIEVLQTVVASAEALETTKEQALADISAIAAGIEMESNIETLVKSKGFSDCIAVISGKTVNVIVKTSGLLPSEVAQIKEIVYETTGTEPSNIKIIEKSA